MRAAGSLAGAILSVLYLRGGACPERDMPDLVSRLRGRAPGTGYRMALHRLRHRHLLHRLQRDSGTLLRLTRRGLASVSLPHACIAAPPAPAGTVYFVSYDIPSSLDDVRKAFRCALRQNGWRRLHKSLWITARDIRDTALRAAEEFAVKPYIFIGTGAILDERPLSDDGAFVEEVLRGAQEVVRDAGRDIAAAYRRWADLTRRLQSPGGAWRLDADLRKAWETATRAIRGALG